MASLQDALVKAGLVSPEVQEEERKFQNVPIELRPLVRRFDELKHRWSKLGPNRFLLGLNFVGMITIQDRKRALELAIAALEKVGE